MKNIYIILFLILSSCSVQQNNVSRTKPPLVKPGRYNPYPVPSREDEVFQAVENMPFLPGCSRGNNINNRAKKCTKKKLSEFIYSNLRYPKGTELVSGIITVRFIVKNDGSVSNARITGDNLQGASEVKAKFEQEAIRVINLMNEKGLKWIPGKQGGIPVNTYYSFSVKFKKERQ